MRPDRPATEDLSRITDCSVNLTEALSDREFFHRFISADRAEPVFILLHDSGGNEQDLLSIVEAGAEDGKANVIALRGLFDYDPGFSFLGTTQEFAPGEPCLIDRADRVSRFFNWAAKEYNLDPAKTVVVGAGDGATLAVTLLFVHSELLGGAILIRPKPLPALPCYPILLINPKNESRDDRRVHPVQYCAQRGSAFPIWCRIQIKRNRHFRRRNR